MKPDNEPKNQYQQILKKIEAESKQKKQQRTINIMRGQASKNKSVKQNRHTAIMTAFLLFSSYIAWTIEQKYDRLKKRAQRTQTFKERQVEKENEYIQRMLKKKQFESVPIPLELQESNTYKFQEKQSRGGLVIDTKQDLMDLISKDKGNTKTPQQIYEEEVRKSKERV